MKGVDAASEGLRAQGMSLYANELLFSGYHTWNPCDEAMCLPRNSMFSKPRAD